MKNTTTELINQIEDLLDNMRLEDAIVVLANAMPHATAVHFYAAIQDAKTEAGRVYVCLQYARQAVQS